MQPLQLGAVDAALAAAIPFIVLILAIVNIATRYLAHRTLVDQAAEHGADGIERHTLHSAVTVLLVIATFYYILVELHPGVILASFALTTFIADFFGFESRLVEARTDSSLEPPKAAIASSLFVLMYAGYTVLADVFGAFWSPII